MKLATVDDMHRLEQMAVDAGATFPGLMEAAGLAAAREAWMMLGGTPGQPVVVLAGPGNNGGDGLVTARHLHDWGSAVRVFTTGDRTGDANAALLQERGIRLECVEEGRGNPALGEGLAEARVAVDALLGTGRSRPIANDSPIGRCLAALGVARETADGPHLLAMDVPTGLDTDTGAVDPLTVSADLTVTFGMAKVGMFQQPGASVTGPVEVVDVGIPGAAEAAVRQELLTSRAVRAMLPSRKVDGNKGTFGRVLVVGGSAQYTGAVLLAGRAAYRAGAGLVTIACPETIQRVVAPALGEATWLPQQETGDGHLAETTALALRNAWAGFSAAVIGPGMGDTESTRALTWAALPDSGNLGGIVIDADALNVLASMADASDRIPANAVLTPHPGEMARLLGTTVADVQSRRVEAAREAAGRFGCTVVLKGACTVIVDAEGFVWLAPFSNALLATAGTGDVLAGCIAGFIAQGLTPQLAAAAGVYVHGLAGEQLAGRYGSAGLLAGELADTIPLATRELRE